MRCFAPGCEDADAGTGVCEAHRLEEVRAHVADALITEIILEDRRREALDQTLDARVSKLMDDVRPWTPPVEPLDPSLWSSADGSAYGLAVLSRACNAIRTAPGGLRNETVAREAYTVGGFVGGGEIAREHALREVCAASQAVGGADRAQMTDTAKRALAAGESEPLRAPSKPLTRLTKIKPRRRAA